MVECGGMGRMVEAGGRLFDGVEVEVGDLDLPRVRDLHPSVYVPKPRPLEQLR